MKQQQSLAAKTNWRSTWETIVRWLLFISALVSVITTIAIVFVLIGESIFGFGGEAFFQKVSLVDFFTDTKWAPQYNQYGILPLLVGTLWVTGIAGAIGIPIGLTTAIYLSEYASNRTRSVVKPILEILAGIPTVVFGYFGMIFITPILVKPLGALFGAKTDAFNALSAGLVVGFMIIPMVSSLSEDVIRAVPRGLREAAYALGATRFEVCVKVVLPAALSGILASFLLAISRALGETMAVTIAGGIRPNISFSPFTQICTMTSGVVAMVNSDAPTESVQYRGLYAVALTLFVITFAMNVLSQFILKRYREVYH